MYVCTESMEELNFTGFDAYLFILLLYVYSFT